MADDSLLAQDYTPKDFELIKSELLYLATVVGEDLMEDVLIVGGIVPSLLIAPPGADANHVPHLGTKDLDVGMKVAMLEEGRYKDLAAKLREAGFVQDVNERNNETRQRWCFAGNQRIAVDFLIPPTLESDEGGTLRHLEKDFAAFIMPGLVPAFEDRIAVDVSGVTLKDERCTRRVWVSGPGGFVVLKALATPLRRKPKDSYDLHYMLTNFKRGPESVATHLTNLRHLPQTKKAIEVLRRDYLEIDGLGPVRVAEFLTGGPNDDIQADVVGAVRLLLRNCGVAI